MNDLVTLCTRGIHFNFSGDTYKQRNGMMMFSPLVPILGILMVQCLIRENNENERISKRTLFLQYVSEKDYTLVKSL